MTRTRARFIPDILLTHLDDLAFLSSQRREALASERHTLRTYAEVNERIEAHVQGLLVAPAPQLLALLTPLLAAAERDEAFAAAYALLRQDTPEGARAVLIEFSRAKGATLLGLRDALGLAPAVRTADELRSALGQAKASTAVAAAVVLSNHRQLDPNTPRLPALLQEADPGVAAPAWRAALLADVASAEPAPARPLQQGVAHASPEVRHAAWSLAAWTAQPQTWSALRQIAGQGDAVALHWLAVLGAPEDAPQIQQAALAMPDPAARCRLLARFGHPSALNALLLWMAEDDVPLAVAAREAFTRITGHDIRGERRRLPVAEGADDFERDMAPDVWMPDAARARALLDQHGSTWAQGSRWCAGHRLDGEVSRELLMQLDLDARWDVAARAALAGRVVSAPPPVH